MANPQDASAEELARADALKSASDNALLADAAMSLLHCRSADEVYKIIAGFISALVPGAVVIVNAATPDSEWLVTREVAGLDDSLLAMAAEIFGVKIIGSRWEMLPEYQNEIFSGELSRLPGGIVELASREVPRAVAEGGTKLFGLHDVFTVGIADGQGALGSVRIITRTRDASVPSHIIESFVRHCYSALERIQSEDALSRSAELRRATLETATDGFWFADIGGKLLEVNPAYCRMSGYSEEELLSMPISDLEVGETVDEIAAHCQLIMTQGSDRFESKHRRRDGPVYDVEVSVSFVPAEGGRFAAFIRDITERKRLEEVMRQSEVTLQRQNAQLELNNSELSRLHELKNQFLGMAAHDLRNPVNLVMNYAELLETDASPSLAPEHRPYVETIGRTSQRMVKLIDLFLDVSLIDAGRFVLELAPLSVPRLLRAAVVAVEPVALNRDVTILAEIEDGLPRRLGDEAMLEQVLVNLLTNAIQHSSRGSSVTVGCRMEGFAVFFSVTDTGKGMDAEECEGLFRAFESAQARKSDGSRGIGLGLLIAQKIVSAHGGHMVVESEPGRGSVFGFTLPATLPVGAASEHGADGEPSIDPQRLSKRSDRR